MAGTLRSIIDVTVLLKGGKGFGGREDKAVVGTFGVSRLKSPSIVAEVLIGTVEDVNFIPSKGTTKEDKETDIVYNFIFIFFTTHFFIFLKISFGSV